MNADTETFTPYKEEKNLALVSGTLAPMLKSLPNGIVHTVAHYPATLKCVY